MKKILVIISIVLVIVITLLLYPKHKTIKKQKSNTVKIPSSYLKDNMFNKYKYKAYKKLKKMTLEEKVGQLFLVHYPSEFDEEDLRQYKLGGYLFFAKDFKDKTREEVIEMISRLQNISDIPIITAVDEEGGIVNRVSSNPKLRSSAFKSPRELYEEGGLERIKEDTKEKTKLLEDLGINLNLAPVVDVSTNEDDYMYERSIGQDEKITSLFAKIVYISSKNSSVTYTLKHFPGYGNNVDTHNGMSIDNRSLDDIEKKDLLPFKEGIETGYEAVLVSHNIVTSIDPDNPSSLSRKVHDILVKDLDFNGITITDDLEMNALTGDYKEIIYKAITAGNNLIIVADYKKSIESVLQLVKENRINEELINKLTFKLLEWKYTKNLINTSKN